MNKFRARLQSGSVAIAVLWSSWQAPAAVYGDEQLIIPPAPVVNEIPNRSGDPENPLRYIDRYGLPGSGPLPGTTLGYPLEPEKSAASPGAASEGQPTESSGRTATRPVGSVTTAGGEDKQKAQQNAAQAQKKKAGVAKKAVNKEVAVAEGNPVAPPVPLRPNPLRDAALLMGAGQYNQALEEIERVLATDQANATAHYMKAVICVYQRDFARAIAEYNEVQRLAPGTDLSRRALEGLKKLD